MNEHWAIRAIESAAYARALDQARRDMMPENLRIYEELYR